MSESSKAVRWSDPPHAATGEAVDYGRSRAELDFWINCVGAALVVVDKRTLVARFGNRAASIFFGLKPEEMVDAPMTRLVGSEANQLLGQIWSAVPIGVVGEAFLIRAEVQERERLLMVQVSKLLVEGEELRLFTFSDAPPTGSYAIAGWQEHVIDLLNWLPFGFEISTADEQIQFANSQFNRLFGYSQDEVENIEDWWLNVYPDPEYRQYARTKWATEVAAARAEDRDMTPFDLEVTTADGGKRTIQFRHRTIGNFHVNLYIDVTRERADARALKSLAETDPLTGAVNRRRFFDVAQQAFDETSSSPVAVLMLDIDHFKVINDTHGHGVGDLVLVEFTRRCQQAVRACDLFSRFGGEEFAVLLLGAGANTAREIAERLRTAVNGKPFEVGGILLPVTVSVGAARRRKNDIIDMTISRADKALYHAKSSGRNRVVLSD